MKYRRLVCVMLSVFVLLTFSGCTAIGIDVESQMRPPKNTGDQELLQNALDTFVLESGVSKYSLKYPNDGQYLSAFILLNELQPPVYVTSMSEKFPDTLSEETGDFCVAFYRPDIDNAKTRIHLLKNVNEKWTSIADVEGHGDAIAEVDFADLDGDAFPELLVGWNLYNTKDKRLYAYDLKNNLALLSSTEIYTSIVVSDLTADKKDELLLLTIEPTTNVTSAKLLSYSSHQLLTLDEVQVDTDILSIGKSITAIFSEETRGVFFDVYKDPNTMVTELLLWEDGYLWAPFYSLASQMNTVTARQIPLNCQDVDEDGVVEWPIFSLLPGYEDASLDEACWKTSWYYYDPSTHSKVFDFDSVVSMEDGYMLKLTDLFAENLTAKYDKTNRVLTLLTKDQDGEKPFLKIQTTTSKKKSDLLEGFAYFDESDSLYFAVWYDKELGITLEEVRYLFSVL